LGSLHRLGERSVAARAGPADKEGEERGEATARSKGNRAGAGRKAIGRRETDQEGGGREAGHFCSSAQPG